MVTPKTILIAGATSMIGQACAHVLEDQKLILLGRDSDKLSVLRQKLEKNPETYVVDISSEQSIKSALDIILSGHKHIDAVIYNAAIYPWNPIESLSLGEWQKTMETNLSGAFLLAKHCVPLMKQKKSGKIILISSIAGDPLGLPNMSAYATSKAGLKGFMRALSLELAPFNINVNSISPGKTFDPSTLSQEEIEKKTASIPLRRFIEPVDIACLAKFLISDQAKNITGQDFIVDGGQSILGDKV